MPTEELEQALFEAKWGDAEADVADVIARMLEIPREAVVRVAFALKAAERSPAIEATFEPEGELSNELMVAINQNVRRGLLRALVRRRIQSDGWVLVHPKKLIKRAEDICSGCLLSLRCVAEGLSTPPKCFEKGPPCALRDDAQSKMGMLMRHKNGCAQVTPTQIRGDKVTVTSHHPKGTFVVDIGDVQP